MIYKIKIQDIATKEEDFVIMGDSYKDFEEHFKDIISHWTERWHYADEGKYAECYGRTIRKNILEIYYSKEKFVSFGGLKMAYIKNYDKEIEEHNRFGNYPKCKMLKDIMWIKREDTFIQRLLKENRVISPGLLVELIEQKELSQTKLNSEEAVSIPPNPKGIGYP